MKDNSKTKIENAHQSLLLISMFSVVMLFAGLTSAYIVSKGSLGSKWDTIVLPSMFYASTCAIFISSVFGYLSVYYCKKDNLDKIKKSLFWTILFGTFFAFFQFLGWKELVGAGKFLSGNNVASSYIYIFTIAHLAHFFGGMLALILAFIRSRKNRYNSTDFNGLKLTIRFWHFLGVLWIYLFAFLIFIN